jgi:hypothetical protein
MGEPLIGSIASSHGSRRPDHAVLGPPIGEKADESYRRP